ncbi:MAG: ABC transporter substrate-binding protein [Anaerolineae bacterium]|jgi:multiple sugar transport system substrate-binding protein|nr:sugar ABC transporter substrate-binding protein [Chloroflexota bacterium]
MADLISRRSFLRLALTALAGTVVAACQPSPTTPPESVEKAGGVNVPAEPADKEEVTLRWGSWSVGNEAFTALADSFQENNPGVKVVQEAAPWAQYWDRLQVQMAGGEAPDIQWMSGAMFLNFVEKGFFLDLTPYSDADGLTLDEYFTQADVFTYQDHVYAWPWFHTVSSGWYNKELFDEAGVDYPPTDWQNTWSWDEFLETAKKLTKTRDDGRQQYGVVVSNAFEQCWGSFIWSNGGDVINSEFTQTTMDSPEAIQGLSFVVDLVQKYKVAPEPGDPSAFIEGMPGPFEAGLCAMEINSSALTMKYSKIEQFTPSAMCLPVAPGGVSACSFNGNPNSIAKSSPNPDVAWDFITYLASPEGMRYFAEEKITVPANIEIAKTVYVSNPPPLNLDVFIKAMDIEKYNDLRFHRLWMEWVNAIQAPIDLALVGETTTEQACQMATADGNEVLSRV